MYIIRKYKYVFLFLISLNSSQVIAADTNATVPAASAASAAPALSNGEVLDGNARNSASVGLLYSPIDLIIPNKVGLHIAWKKSTTEFWEFEALSGKVAVPYLIADLGKMTDNRYSLLLRTKESDSSFNLTYGVTFFDFSIVLGDRFLNSLSGSQAFAVDVVQEQSLGVSFGFGNRWNLGDSSYVGVDWFTWSQPLISINNKAPFLDRSAQTTEKDDVERATKILSYFPRISLLKVYLGFRF
jgi:hypothetical protein